MTDQKGLPRSNLSYVKTRAVCGLIANGRSAFDIEQVDVRFVEA